MYLINSRTQLCSRLIIALLKNLNCIGELFLLRLEEEYWRSPFFNQFYWSEF